MQKTEHETVRTAERPAPVYTLTRFAHTEYGILGRIGPWYTLENPWRNNQRNVSAIPAGAYLCRRSYYNRGGYEAFEITGVPGRSHILIHAGNTAGDTQGCPLVGTQLGVLGGRLAVLNSRLALSELMAELEGHDEFELIIIDRDGVSNAG